MSVIDHGLALAGPDAKTINAPDELSSYILLHAQAQLGIILKTELLSSHHG
jgi:hypothetical protein